jgi:hypothetical protein
MLAHAKYIGKILRVVKMLKSNCNYGLKRLNCGWVHKEKKII